LKLEGSLLVIETDGLEVKTDSAVGICRCLTQSVVRPRAFKKLMEKEKHGATFATLENNPASNGMLTNVKTTRSNAFFRFVVAERADLLPTPANVEQWYRKPISSCHKCDSEARPTQAHILNGCRKNFVEITHRHNKVVEMTRRAIVEYMRNSLLSPIGENVTVQEEELPDTVRSLRPDLNFVTSDMGEEFTMPVDISSPFGRISYGKNMLENVFIDNSASTRSWHEKYGGFDTCESGLFLLSCLRWGGLRGYS
jgi:hypothetical protein